MRHVPPALALVAFALATGPLPLAGIAFAQQAGLTVQQVQRKYHNMAEVHILKCDRNGDQLIERSEMPCVSSIYRVMYIDR